MDRDDGSQLMMMMESGMAAAAPFNYQVFAVIGVRCVGQHGKNDYSAHGI